MFLVESETRLDNKKINIKRYCEGWKYAERGTLDEIIGSFVKPQRVHVMFQKFHRMRDSQEFQYKCLNSVLTQAKSSWGNKIYSWC